MILAILQARMSSRRLPGKVLKPLLGQPMLLRQIERIRHSERIDQLIVATSDTADDDVIVDILQRSDVMCFRGSLNDVLDRFYQAALPLEPDFVVRLTGDCPLQDPTLIDELIEFALENDYDYASNAHEPTYPDGLDVQVVRWSCLQEAWQKAKSTLEREHVLRFIHQQPQHYRIGSLKYKEDLSNLRWTVDELEDYLLVQQIFSALYPCNPKFGFEDILDFLRQRPELSQINQHHQRNVGLRQNNV